MGSIWNDIANSDKDIFNGNAFNGSYTTDLFGSDLGGKIGDTWGNIFNQGGRNTGVGAATSSMGLYGIPSLYNSISNILNPPKPSLQNPALAGAPPTTGGAAVDQGAATLGNEVAAKASGQAGSVLSPLQAGLDSNPNTTSRVLLGS